MSSTRRIVKRWRKRRTRYQRGGWRAVRWATILLLSAATVVMLGLLGGAGALANLYGYYGQQVPDPSAVQQMQVDAGTTRIYDRTGEHLLYEISGPAERTWTPTAQIPPSLRQATAAAIEPEGDDGSRAIARQLVTNVLSTDGSRIETWALTTRLNQTYENDQILEWYLNTSFYGNLAYGVEAAAQVYFGKPVSSLTLAESAMLAGIPRSPTINPIDNPALAEQQQRRVLDAMVAQGVITPAEAERAAETPLAIQPPEQRPDLLAPHFSVAARKQLETLPGITPAMVYRGGLEVTTTLDYELHQQAECAVQSHIERLRGGDTTAVVETASGQPCIAADYLYPLSGESAPATNAAFVVIDAATGQVLTLYGSLGYYDQSINGNVNRALTPYQPGAAFMPFTYLTGFERGYTPATMTLDVPLTFELGTIYTPADLDGGYYGPQSVRAALANSYDVPAVQVASWVGVQNVIRTAHAMGINTIDIGADTLGIAQGLGETTLYDTTYAYSVLASMGTMHGVPAADPQPGFRTLDPALILRVETTEGDILWEYGEGQQAPIIEPALTYLVNHILADDAARRPSLGERSPLDLSGREAAAKIGANTTVGYTPQIVTGVWVDDAPGEQGAAPVWRAIMTYAHRTLNPQTWEQPPSIVSMTVCQTSGLLPTGLCPTREEIFIQGTEPTQRDNVYRAFVINRETGQLATVYTPAALIEEQVFMVLPPEADAWLAENDIPQPPTAYDAYAVPDTDGPLAITTPEPFAIRQGAVEVRGNVDIPDLREYRLDYGSGLNPQQWQRIGEADTTSGRDLALAMWDTSGLNGLYTLRLTAVTQDSRLEEFILYVTIDNTPPVIEIRTPEPEEQFSLGEEFVVIQPTITDNVGVDRVEFYVDGQLIATSTVPPYNERWIITEPGRHIIEVRAYDDVGNSALSESVAITVVP